MLTWDTAAVEEKDCSTCGSTLAVYILNHPNTGGLVRFVDRGLIIKRERLSRFTEEVDIEEDLREGPAASDQIICEDCAAKHVPEPMGIWDWMKKAKLELL